MSKNRGNDKDRGNEKDRGDRDEVIVELEEQGIHFSIFDTFINDENSDQSEAIIYFYPEEKNNRPKALFGGMVTSISGAINDFFDSESKIDYVRYDRHIMAYKFVDTYTLTLAAHKSIPASTILHHLDYIYDAFTLYCKSFKDVKTKESRINMNKVFEEIMEIVSNGLYKNRMKSFLPLPYTPLPPSSNRTFLRSSQTIHNIIFPDHLGGALFVKNNLLISTIDLDITRHIVDKIEYAREKAQNHSASSPQLSGASIPNDISITVYISPKHYDQLIQYKMEYTGQQQQNIHPQFQQVQPDQQQQQQQQQSSSSSTSTTKKEQKDISESFIAVELLLLFWKDVTVAVLTPPVPNTTRYINKIRNLLISSDIEQLDKDPALQNPNTMYHTTISSSNGYHFLSYNSLTQLAVASGMTNESEEVFINTCSSIHDTFNDNSSITQMFLRNQNGEIFCKKQFGSEIYYQPRGQASSNAFIENCETTVQDILRNHDINIM